MVSVTLVDLVPDKLHTLDLFAQEEGGPQRAQLARTMDALNQKYGTHTLYFGGMHLARASAPTRIAFSSIPDLF
jgi:DNA polymerase-4